MSRSVIILPRAKADLHDAAAWWAEHRSSEQALRWYEGFIDALESLADQPERHPPARENERFPYDIRELHYGLGSRPTHRAVFTIRPDAVVVLTIRHAARADISPEDV